MRALPWILAGVGIGLTAYVVLAPDGRRSVMGSDDLEDAARSVFRWGTNRRVAGIGAQLSGKLKEGVGKITGNDNLAQEGIATQVAGTIEDAAGGIGRAVGETMHELNK